MIERPKTIAWIAPLAIFAGAIGATIGGDLPRGAADEPASAREQLLFFEQEVRPLLVEKCVKCHGEKSQKGDLRLDSREGVLAGGQSGAAVLPGKPEESLLVEAVHRRSLEMPPDEVLSETQVTTLERWVSIGAPWGDSLPLRAASADGEPNFSDADRAWWAIQPLARVSPPELAGDDWSRNEIDRFLLARLRDVGLSPSPPAAPRELLRRLSFDLVGLPPSAEEVDEFERRCAQGENEAQAALAEAVERLLASPRYGERWARKWLDLVRYAESDGFKADDFRPDAWRYRDYVIASLNADKPYDRFVKEQLAGDELAPDNAEAAIAAGFLRLGIYEYNQRDVRGQRSDNLNDITDVVGDALLGLGIGCARCHDHKFDPILQKDYFRLRAFFEPLLPNETADVTPTATLRERQMRQEEWEAATAEIRAEMGVIEAPHFEKAYEASVVRFPPDILAMIRKNASERSPLERQLAELALRQPKYDSERLDVAAKLSGEEKEKYLALRKRLAEFEALRPAPPETAMTARDGGPLAPPTIVPGDLSQTPIEPGYLSLLDPAPAAIAPPRSDTTGRRLALAEWIASSDNALTMRVIVNRLWQHHFGKGLVATPSDFGRLGEPPSHGELLDWLAARFASEGQSLKALHRLIVTSAAYAQSSAPRPMDSDEALAARVDPENRLLHRANTRRLEAEEIRDALLAASGELDLATGGPSAAGESRRRSLYLRAMRNVRDGLLDAFDLPYAFVSASERLATCTPAQALLMINGEAGLARAQTLAGQLIREHPGDDDASESERLRSAWRRALSRDPDERELTSARAFLAQARSENSLAALADLCHVLLNSNEFLHVD